MTKFGILWRSEFAISVRRTIIDRKRDGAILPIGGYSLDDLVKIWHS
jgi:hypothetical protein